MRRLMNWLTGFALGGGVATALVALLVPLSSEEVRQRLRAGYVQAMEEARQASQARRAELEAELKRLQNHQETTS